MAGPNRYLCVLDILTGCGRRVAYRGRTCDGCRLLLKGANDAIADLLERRPPKEKVRVRPVHRMTGGGGAKGAD